MRNDAIVEEICKLNLGSVVRHLNKLELKVVGYNKIAKRIICSLPYGFGWESLDSNDVILSDIDDNTSFIYINPYIVMAEYKFKFPCETT